MEKFGLLNLLKAIDGLNAAQKETTAPSPAPEKTAETKRDDAFGAPNVVYEKLLVHEAMSNRLKNKRK